MAMLHTLCVELTTRCPLRCVHRSADASPNRQEISLSLFLPSASENWVTFKNYISRVASLSNTQLSLKLSVLQPM
jgi:hypothetical protein